MLADDIAAAGAVWSAPQSAAHCEELSVSCFARYSMNREVCPTCGIYLSNSGVPYAEPVIMEGWDVIVMTLIAAVGVALLFLFWFEEHNKRLPAPLERFRYPGVLGLALVVIFCVTVFAAWKVETLFAHGLHWRLW